MRQVRTASVSLRLAALLVSLLVGASGRPSNAASETSPPRRVREPAVAGLFYPKEQAALSQMVGELLAEAAPHTIDGELKALVCPHAGYPYSGPVAAVGYRLLLGRSFRNVVILGPSHYAEFRGVSVPDVDAYRTPLGLVRLSPKAKELAGQKPFVLEPRRFVARPEWVRVSSKPAPPVDEDTPDTWEHSVEVEVPFLQKTLSDFTILPAVTGAVDPAEAARVLDRFLDDQTLVVVSTDLSHYHPYDEARALDGRCVAAITNLDVERMKSQEACGRTAVLILLHLAQDKGWKTKLLDYRNSGDTTGDKHRVVGYTAIALYVPAPATLAAAERHQLLELARASLRRAAAGEPNPAPAPSDLTGKLAERKGCFVTLTKHGALRGCIGHIFPQEPLAEAITENATSAALHDPRFSPVQPAEVDQIAIEISVLTVPAPLAFQSPADLLGKLHPHRDGVVLRLGDKVATYLPQVWSQLPDKAQFLDSLAVKAVGHPDEWREPGTQVLIYHVESFSESEP